MTRTSCLFAADIILPWLFPWQSDCSLACLCFLNLRPATKVHPLSFLLKVFDAGLVFSSFDGISSERTTGSRLPNYIMISFPFKHEAKLYFFEATEWFTLCWHEGACLLHGIDMWLASTVSSKSRMILPFLVNYIMRSLSIMHFFKRVTNDPMVPAVLWVGGPPSFFWVLCLDQFDDTLLEQVN